MVLACHDSHRFNQLSTKSVGFSISHMMNAVKGLLDSFTIDIVGDSDFSDFVANHKGVESLASEVTGFVSVNVFKPMGQGLVPVFMIFLVITAPMVPPQLVLLGDSLNSIL